MRDVPAARRSEQCLNCGTATPGNFCQECGQRNTHYHVSTWALLGEVASELFQLDSRLMSTLGTLLFRPGRLTADYVAGRRVRFSPPLRVYLVTSLLYFVVLSSLPALVPQDAPAPGATAAAASGSRAKEDSAFAEMIRQRVEELQKPTTIDAKQRFVQALLAQVPKALFLLLPMFALCLKLVYVRRRRFYSEHLVFAFHVHAFVFVALTAAALTRQTWAVIAAAGLGLVYLFLALRRVYGQGRFRTFLKLNVLLFLYFWAAVLAAALAALLAFAVG